MRYIVLAAALFACAMGAPRYTLPRLPLSVLLQGNMPLIDADSRIVGGVVVPPNSIPFQVSLQRRATAGGSFSQSCGGSILGTKTILNAAHCVSGNPNLGNMRIVAGMHSLSNPTGTEQYLTISRVQLNTAYNANTFQNDISLIFLNEVITYNTAVGPVNLPPADMANTDVPAGTMVTVSGWGTTSSGGSISDLLRAVDVPVVSDADCNVSYGAGSIYPSMICAGFPEGGKDSCQGDSGGPLYTGTGLAAIQWGIVSWGYGCAVAGFPGVYTEVQYFLDWIAANNNP